MIRAWRSDGTALVVEPTAVDRVREARAAAAIEAARADLPSCPPITVRWFADLGDTGPRGFVRPTQPSVVWLWAGLDPVDVAGVARHETFHSWARGRRLAHTEAHAVAFAARTGQPVLEVLLGGQPLHVVPSPPLPTIRITRS